MQLKSVLIANRGEIAVRLIRGYRELGVQTVAVYSDADESALHVRLADASCRIGPPPVAQSYLNIKAIIEAAKESRVDAIDPGYGLLSENADFARATAEAGLVFIGPTPDAITTMGNKVAARELARLVGIPTVPGSQAEVTSLSQALELAEEIGYPLLVKTSFGGGGRGIRVVMNKTEIPEALTSSAAEAKSSFGRSEIYLERQIADARHVEVQILGDSHGNIIHLGDRDCSVQRRHQKLIEEAPAPFLGDEVRAELRASAVALAKAVQYQSTGTVEFLYDPDTSQFYFLEMNTRLQVEHGVTELINGIDLIQVRLAIASGERLSISQDDVRTSGHAIEVRLMAEDPQRHFMPSSGRVHELRVPGGPWLRADFGVDRGDEIASEYDSMFGKLMAWGPNRESARQRLVAALAEFRLDGVPTTGPYLRHVLQTTEFISGNHSTTSIERSWPAIELPEPDNHYSQGLNSALDRGGQSVRNVKINTSQGQIRLNIYGLRRIGSESVAADIDGSRIERRTSDPRTNTSTLQPVAPMDGLVVKVEAEAGINVKQNATLFVLEAMKMQIPVIAPWAGTVIQVMASEGEHVTAGQQLAELSIEASELTSLDN